MKKKSVLQLVSFLSLAVITIMPVLSSPAKDTDDKEKLIEIHETPKPENIHAAVLNGSSGMCLAYMFENAQEINTVSVSYEVCGSPDVLLPKLLKGDIDIGVLPPNAAAKLYAKAPSSIVVGAVTGMGMLSVVTKDPTVAFFADLKGKTVYAAGQGATPEYLFRYLMEKNGIAAKDITLDFSIPANELAAALIADKISYALVPEPFASIATVKKTGVRRAINIQEQWKTIQKSDENYPMTVIVIRREFAQNYPDFVRAFLDKCAVSIEWTEANAEKAGALVEKHTLGLKAPVAAMTIPNCAFTFIKASEARPEIEKLLSVFLEYAPESIGGKLPDDGFYFK